MDSYVWVPTPKDSHISWAFPGMYVTKRLVKTVKGELRATWAVFRRDYFEKNYFENQKDAVDQTWELEDRSPKKTGTKVIVEVDKSENVEEIVGKVQHDLKTLAKLAGVELKSDEVEAS